MLEVSSLVNTCGEPFKKPEEAPSVCGVFPFLSGQRISQINAVKIRDACEITFRDAERAAESLFLKLADAVSL